MFKKSILIILVALSCNNIHGALDNQVSRNDLNGQEKKEHTPQSCISYTLINVLGLSAAYVAVTYFTEKRESWAQTATAQYLVYLGLITTTGSVIADGMNHLREEAKEDREHKQHMAELYAEKKYTVPKLKEELLKFQSK